MLLSLVRVVFGFALACLAAGLVQVLFVLTPAEFAGLPAHAMIERAQGAGTLMLLAATQSAVFAMPFALVAAGLGEWQGIRSWIYYASGGIGIALAGFLTQLAGESGGKTVVNGYALGAFLAAGLIAGLVYWAVAGRKACRSSRP
jgi:hypothetical protein